MEIPTSKTPTVDCRFFTILQKVATRPQKSDFVQKQYIYIRHLEVFFVSDSEIFPTSATKIPQNGVYIYCFCTKSHFCGRVATFCKIVKKRQSTVGVLRVQIWNFPAERLKKPLNSLRNINVSGPGTAKSRFRKTHTITVIF